MRWGVRIAALPALLVSMCFAQQPTGPQTLETLLQQTEEPQQPEVESTPKVEPKPATPHTQGTYQRPEDGVQHPDLDKAWATYDYAVTQANGTVTAALTQLFDAAAEKGDLDAADKWQTLRDKFQKEGVLPDEKQVQSVVKAAVQGIKSANDELRDAYDQLVKSLTKEKKIAEAKAVRDEWKAFEAENTPLVQQATAGPKQPEPPQNIQWSLEMEVFDVDGGQWGKKIVALNGVPLGELPTCKGQARQVTLPIPDKCKVLQKRIAAASIVTEGSVAVEPDCFSVRQLRLVATFADGREVSGRPTGTLCSAPGWDPKAERLFNSPENSGPIAVEVPREVATKAK